MGLPRRKNFNALFPFFVLVALKSRGGERLEVYREGKNDKHTSGEHAHFISSVYFNGNHAFPLLIIK